MTRNLRAFDVDVRASLGVVSCLIISGVVACSSTPDDAGADAGKGGTTANGGSAGTSAGKGAGPGPGGQSGAGGSGHVTAGTGPGTGGAGSSAGGVGSGGKGFNPAGGAGPNSGGTGPSAGTSGDGTGGAAAGSGGSGAGAGGKGGGVAGSGGSGGSGGKAGPLGPDLTDVSTFTPADCTITPSVTPAAKIGMVGVATFTTDLAGADRAIIQFGKTSEYTLEAPVNWADAMKKTLLLGMPANTEVHYRVVVIQGNSACIGADQTFETGAAPQGAPGTQTPTKGTSTVAPSPGFIIAQNGNYSYIVNNEGEVVWAYRFPIMLTRSLMSWDGKYMIARDIGPFNASSGGSLYRVGMDGEGELKLNVSGGHHHDFTVTPTGIAYAGKVQAGACDSLFTADYDGSNSKAVVDLDVVFGKFPNGPGSASMEKCHVNAIRYYADTDSFSFSDREKDAIAHVSSSGQVLGSVGATPNGSTPNHAKAEGADSSNDSDWRVQHGHELYEPNKLVLWSNGSFMGGQSRLLHYTINGANATLDWSYSGTGNSPTFSGAQHLPNGNFMGTNSQTGAVHEIDPTQKLVQSFAALCRGGYSFARPTLYGPPPGR
jgi:hypothetical protein